MKLQILNSIGVSLLFLKNFTVAFTLNFLLQSKLKLKQLSLVKKTPKLAGGNSNLPLNSLLFSRGQKFEEQAAFLLVMLSSILPYCNSTTYMNI